MKAVSALAIAAILGRGVHGSPVGQDAAARNIEARDWTVTVTEECTETPAPVPTTFEQFNSFPEEPPTGDYSIQTSPNEPEATPDADYQSPPFIPDNYSPEDAPVPEDSPTPEQMSTQIYNPEDENPYQTSDAPTDLVSAPFPVPTNAWFGTLPHEVQDVNDLSVDQTPDDSEAPVEDFDSQPAPEADGVNGGPQSINDADNVAAPINMNGFERPPPERIPIPGLQSFPTGVQQVVPLAPTGQRNVIIPLQSPPATPVAAPSAAQPSQPAEFAPAPPNFFNAPPAPQGPNNPENQNASPPAGQPQPAPPVGQAPASFSAAASGSARAGWQSPTPAPTASNTYTGQMAPFSTRRVGSGWASDAASADANPGSSDSEAPLQSNDAASVGAKIAVVVAMACGFLIPALMM